jgi:acyl carrier protein
MNKEEILNKLQDIFRDVFDDDTIVIREDSDADDIDEWDSFNNISLMSAIEKSFNIKFDLAELQDLEDVGAMADVILKKL